MAENKGYSERYAKASRIIYRIMWVIGILFAISVLIFVVLKQFFIKAISFLFDGDHWYKVAKTILDVIRNIIGTIIGSDPFGTDWLPHTNTWSESFANATTDSGTKWMTMLLICLVILIVAYIITMVMRHHYGEMAPLLNDSQSRKVKRKIIRKIDVGYINRSNKEKNKQKATLSKFEKKVRRHIRRKLKVRIHTFIPEGSPVAVKHYNIRIRRGKTTTITEQITKKIKDLHTELTDITDNVKFDAQKFSENFRYFIFEGRQEKELKEAKSVIKQREEINNSPSQNVSSDDNDVNNGYNYPLDILSENPKTIAKQTKKAEKFADKNQGKVDVLLASMGMQVEAKKPRIFNSAIEYIYGTRFTQASKSLDEIGKALEQELSVKDIKVDKQADNMIINIPLPQDDRIPIDGGKLIERAFSEGIENPTHAVLGQNVENNPVDFLFSKGPHTLLAGTSGSGKSVASKFTLASMLAKSTPDELLMQIIDPKQTDFVPFNRSPFNLTDVITDIKNDVVPFLKYIVYVMEERYTMLKNAGGMENIEEYNEWAVENNKDKLPYIVIFMDEVSDMMAQIQDEVELAITRLGQMGRASGIHLILSTQRPSREVITGLIKTNLATRWAMSVRSDTDSRIILEESGAEKLNGQGDMLFSPQGTQPIRAQGANIKRKQLEQIFDALNEKFEKPPSPDYHAIVARKEAEENGEDEESNETFSAMTALQSTRLEQDSQVGQQSIENYEVNSDLNKNDSAHTFEEPMKNDVNESEEDEEDELTKAIRNREKRRAARKNKNESDEETEDQPTFEIDTSNLVRDKDR
ncbi:hypothetical protein MHZ36_12805 [Staphylococcus sp. ACRSN]|uniref:FtsK/SpoIIIE domain-containing protein n=1 Tax=Staphylococcus sp. ACRSN TaxID=2918214 RepID=UPI001EF21746|nr:FtsK/SpoIIIE domain-containing protein [Staphylococcus sp. ACRSN]MCG7340169.1 hypothetical protein [Staphylococcus sp. ACRSN]